MFFIYQIFIILILFLSPFIILVRLIKKKEHKRRFLEKFCLPSQKRSEGKLIWIHAASVGEFLSAENEDSFKSVLKFVISQALNNTTAQINLNNI